MPDIVKPHALAAANMWPAALRSGQELCQGDAARPRGRTPTRHRPHASSRTPARTGAASALSLAPGRCPRPPRSWRRPSLPTAQQRRPRLQRHRPCPSARGVPPGGDGAGHRKTSCFGSNAAHVCGLLRCVLDRASARVMQLGPDWAPRAGPLLATAPTNPYTPTPGHGCIGSASRSREMPAAPKVLAAPAPANSSARALKAFVPAAAA